MSTETAMSGMRRICNQSNRGRHMDEHNEFTAFRKTPPSGKESHTAPRQSTLGTPQMMSTPLDPLSTALRPVFTSGLTTISRDDSGHLIVWNPDDAAAEIAYIKRRGYPIAGIEWVELMEACSAEDYGALYLQWAEVIHKVDRSSSWGAVSKA